MIPSLRLFLLCSIFTVPVSQSLQAADKTFDVLPASIELVGNFSRAQLVVAKVDAAGAVSDRSLDLISEAIYKSSDEKIVSISESGQLLAVGNGQATITVSVEGVPQEIPVTVKGIVEKPSIRFIEDVRPLLTKAGCNMGACHASQFGKGAFHLSVLGSDPENDHRAIVRQEQQRRVNLVSVEKSLFLQKPTMQVPHGGARRIKKGSIDYQILVAWLNEGASGPQIDAPKVTGITVTPARRVSQPGEQQQLRVEATYNNGTTRDVTAWAKYDSMDEGILSVNSAGMITTEGKGQAPVMIRFEGQAAISMFVVPYAESVELAGWQNNNFVDEHASAKFQELGIIPSGLCDDATFVRRAFLDATGTLPNVAETKTFLQSTEPNKREHLIDRLLGLTGDPNLDIYNDRLCSILDLEMV